MQVNFRNLAGRPLELWVAHLAAEYYAAGTKVLIRAASADRVRSLDQALWTYDRASFLPHGTDEAGRAAEQPILLTDSGANPNAAEALILVDHGAAPAEQAWNSIDYVFERNDPAAREAARQQWRAWREQGFEPVYWEPDAQGWRRAG